MGVAQQLKDALAQETYVRLNMEGESREGFVVGLGPDLVLLQVIDEWHDAGAAVLPIDVIESCDVSEWHDDQQKVIAFNSVKRTKRYAWVKLGTWADVFKSLAPKAKFIVLSFGDEADVGQIDAVNADSVDLKAVDPGGNWIGDTLECPFEDITALQFDDNYSRVLQRYVERAAAMN
ncbi:MAG: hypothetical protein JF571_04445 [Asticcacaulis sp.]|nr:hypothetical protein [Asticcacaulis sp.]